MCGRFAFHASRERLMQRFGLAEVPELAPRYNITPQSDIAAVRDGGCALLRWGLVPFWAKDPKIGNRMINAKAETVAEKPAFRHAFAKRRCLIPASGFYEWRRTAGGKIKIPYYIHPADDDLFAFAGLWERWHGKDAHAGEVIESCTILTTEANALCARIHDRMPVIVAPEHWRRWLERPDAALLAPYPPARMRAHPVSRRVNDPSNDDPDLLTPAEG